MKKVKSEKEWKTIESTHIELISLFEQLALIRLTLAMPRKSLNQPLHMRLECIIQRLVVSVIEVF